MLLQSQYAPDRLESYPDTEILQCHIGSMVQKLTQKSIDRLPPASGKRYEVRDSLAPGLILRTPVGLTPDFDPILGL